jgi:hypothetical protein
MPIKRVQKSTKPMVIDEGGCAHYWQIQSPDGSTSGGICKRCGERREFFNSAQALAEARAAAELAAGAGANG